MQPVFQTRQSQLMVPQEHGAASSPWCWAPPQREAFEVWMSSLNSLGLLLPWVGHVALTMIQGGRWTMRCIGPPFFSLLSIRHMQSSVSLY